MTCDLMDANICKMNETGNEAGQTCLFGDQSTV